MNNTDDIEQVLTSMLRLMVDLPDEVRVVGRETDGILSLSITVAEMDRVKVIGMRGATARSLWVISGALMSDSDRSVTLDFG